MKHVSVSEDANQDEVEAAKLDLNSILLFAHSVFVLNISFDKPFFRVLVFKNRLWSNDRAFALWNLPPSDNKAIMIM